MNTDKTKIWTLYLALIIPATLLFISAKLFAGSTYVLAIYKIVFLLPFIYHMKLNKKTFKMTLAENFSLQRFKKFFYPTAGFAAIAISVYFTTYWLLKDNLSMQDIRVSLNQIASIDAHNVLIFGLYVIVLNSLFEEFFWRGFIFKEMYLLVPRWSTYIVTGTAFSLHHVIYFYTWFSLPLFTLAVFGLFSFAIFMALYFQKTKDLFSCWLIHACADTTQIYLGLKVFGII